MDVKFWSGNLISKTYLGRPRHRWVNNTKTDRKQTEYEGYKVRHPRCVYIGVCILV